MVSRVPLYRALNIRAQSDICLLHFYNIHKGLPLQCLDMFLLSLICDYVSGCKIPNIQYLQTLPIQSSAMGMQWLSAHGTSV